MSRDADRKKLQVHFGDFEVFVFDGSKSSDFVGNPSNLLLFYQSGDYWTIPQFFWHLVDFT